MSRTEQPCDNCGARCRGGMVYLEGYRNQSQGGVLIREIETPLWFCSQACFRAYMRLELQGEAPATFREFALSGAYRSRTIAQLRVAQFLAETGRSELAEAWKRRGISPSEWAQFVPEWKRWSRQHLIAAKTRTKP